MTKEEKAYIAGVIDGEGSIMLIKFHNNQFPSPCVSIASTTIELLEWIKSKAGVGNIIRKKKRARLIIENYKRAPPRNGRYSTEVLEAKEKFYEDFIKIK